MVLPAGGWGWYGKGGVGVMMGFVLVWLCKLAFFGIKRDEE